MDWQAKSGAGLGDPHRKDDGSRGLSEAQPGPIRDRGHYSPTNPNGTIAGRIDPDDSPQQSRLAGAVQANYAYPFSV